MSDDLLREIDALLREGMQPATSLESTQMWLGKCSVILPRARDRIAELTEQLRSAEGQLIELMDGRDKRMES